jgi:hypothetical protein
MPAAAPQAISTESSRGRSRTRRPSVEASAEPSWMMGPSRPVEPPEPITAHVAAERVSTSPSRTSPLRRETASMMSAMPKAPRRRNTP